MAEALARGFIAGGKVQPGDITASATSDPRKEVFRGFGANAADSNQQVVDNSQIVFVSVKPPYVVQVLKEVSSSLTNEHIVVSIAAGIPLGQMQEAAGKEVRLIRVMPNTPCLVGETASAMCLGSNVSEENAAMVLELMSSVGTCLKVNEALFSGVTGLSGSGPAYVYLMIEAMADGGVRAGLPRDTAQTLAAQTVLGAAKMVLETGMQPGALKDQVTSPAGTTIAGVHALETGAFRATVMNAVLASASRADELSK
ncbi:hypothetical protein WJX73_009483 [Symbiochloris irregularis]|uniref:Pyrroline-5-carboxylate reductase n=1 Tax=Symbiochloris irregularis TaxID=706552 RepID=A0AAW1NZV8_9CHLO